MSPKQSLFLEVDVPTEPEEFHSIIISESSDGAPGLLGTHSAVDSPDSGAIVTADARKCNQMMPD